MKATNTLRLHNTELLTVKAVGTYSYHWARANFVFANSFIYNIIVKSCPLCIAHYDFNVPSDNFFDHLITFLLALLRQRRNRRNMASISVEIKCFFFGTASRPANVPIQAIFTFTDLRLLFLLPLCTKS
jgi:hypothetical protein